MVVLVVVHCVEDVPDVLETFESISFSSPPHSGLPLSLGWVQMSPLALENTVPTPHSNLKVVNGLPLPQSTHL